MKEPNWKYDSDRAARATEALLAVSAECTELEPISIAGDETFLIDVLTDLMHFCAREEIDFFDCVETAQQHYEAETDSI